MALQRVQFKTHPFFKEWADTIMQFENASINAMNPHISGLFKQLNSIMQLCKEQVRYLSPECSTERLNNILEFLLLLKKLLDIFYRSTDIEHLQKAEFQARQLLLQLKSYNMSRDTNNENLARHSLFKTWDKTFNLLKTANINKMNADMGKQFELLASTMQNCQEKINFLSPECDERYFDYLLEFINRLSNSIVSFLNTPDVNTLIDARLHAESLLSMFSRYSLYSNPIQEDNHLKHLIDNASDIINNVSNQSRVATELIAKLQSQSELSAQRLGQFEQTIELQKGRLDQSIEAFQKQFSDSEAARRKEIQTTENNFNIQFQQIKDTISKDIKTLIDSQKKDFLDMSSKVKVSAEQLLIQMEEKKNAAAKVLNVSTNVAQSGAYGRYAFYEKIESEIFRGVALLFMVGLIWGAYLTIGIALATKQVDWQLFLIRAITTFTLAIPAFYAVKESNKHRITESRYRKMQLELAAIDPYLELMEKPQRNQIKEKLSERFFAQPEAKDDASNVDAGSLLNIIKDVLMTVVKK